MAIVMTVSTATTTFWFNERVKARATAPAVIRARTG